MKKFLSTDIKFFKRCLFVGLFILLPQIFTEIIFDGIIWSFLSALVSTALICGYLYYLFHRIKIDIEYISGNVELLYLQESKFENITRSFQDQFIQKLSRRFNEVAGHLNRTVENLSSEKTKLSAVLDTMADGVIVLDKEGMISLVNQSAITSFSIKLGSFEGVKFIEVVRDHEIQKMVDHCLKTKEISGGEVEVSSGGFFYVLVIPLLSTDNLIHEGVLITFHDISRFRRLENTRREFVANVSHELRNPLAGIKALAESLEHFDDLDTDIRKEFIYIINLETTRFMHD